MTDEVQERTWDGRPVQEEPLAQAPCGEGARLP